MMKTGHQCAQNCTLKSLCHFGDGKNSGDSSLTFLLMKHEKKSAAIDELNEILEKLICGSRWISVDETMRAWKPRKTATGGLPNISFIIRKPEPLGKI